MNTFQAAKAARLEETGRDSFAPTPANDDSIFFNQGGGGRQPVWRRNQHGDLVKIEPEDEDPTHLANKIKPPTGDYVLRVIGFSHPAQEINTFHKEGDEKSRPFVTKTWIEFEIVSGEYAGKWFSNHWTWPMALRKSKQGNTALMAEFAINLLGEEQAAADDFDRRDFIGMVFKGRVKSKPDSNYAKLDTEEITPLQGEAETSITLDQAGVIEKWATDVWGGPEKKKLWGKQKLMVLLEGQYDGKDLDDLTYDEADQLINWFETDQPGLKDAVTKWENAEYADVPELVK